VNYELKDNIAVITFDNGKANAVNPDFMDAIDSFLDKAEKEADAVVLAGRTGMFSAGYDLKIIQADPEAGKAMIERGLGMLYRFYSFPKPLVAACDGHAIGLGAFMLMVADTRIGADTEYFVRLPETAINMPFGDLLMEIAKSRLNRQEHIKRIVQSVPCTPSEAVTAGFLDALVPQEQLMATAMKVASDLAELPAKYYAQNKLDVRRDSLKIMADSIKVDSIGG
jgi:enoyl-CoA hydratase